MSILTNSKLDENVTYENEEDKEVLSSDDEGIDSDIYKINIFGDLYLIAIGKVKIHPKNNKIAYVNVYILLNKKVANKIGVYEKLIDDDSMQDEMTNKNFGIDNMDLLLFQKFYSQRYRLQPLIVNDLDIENIQRELTSVQEETKEEEATAENNDDLDKGLYQDEEETKEEEDVTQIIEISPGIRLESHREKSSEDLRQIIQDDVVFQKVLELMERKKEVPEEKFLQKRILIAKKLLSEITTKMLDEKYRSIYNKMLMSFHSKIDKPQHLPLFKSATFDINEVTLFIVELVYNMKFITVNNDNTLSFSLLPDIESSFDPSKEKYVKMISDGDPHFFVFVEKKNGVMKPVNVENKHGNMTNIIDFESMSLPLLQKLKELFQDYNATKNKSSLYTIGNHYESLKMISGGNRKLKFKQIMRN
jgi:hypothetical protein